MSTQAKYAVLINADSGVVMYEKNKDDVCFPASTTKIATLLYILERNPEFSLPVIISKEAVAVVPAYEKKKNIQQYPPYILEHDGTMMGIRAGETWQVKDLLYGLMLSSGNDSANALAEYWAGSIEEFVGGLNQFLKNGLGLKNTSFSNPHGLHHPDHYTTAHDLAKLTQAALKNEKFREIVKATHYEPASSVIKSIVQHNKLLKNGPYFYSKAIGVKTGYHSNAGYNLVAAAEEEGRCLIAILMGYDDPNQRFKDATALFEKAFKEQKLVRTLFAKQFDRFSVSIPKADKILNARLAADIKLEYFPSEEPKLQSSIIWAPLKLPIVQGGCVGEVKIVDDTNTLIISAPIFSEERVDKKLFFKVIDVFKHKAFLAGLFEAAIVLGFIIYFRNRRVKNKRQSSKDRSSGRD